MKAVSRSNRFLRPSDLRLSSRCLDPRLRRGDDVWKAPAIVIPAKAGIHETTLNPLFQRTPKYSSPKVSEHSHAAKASGASAMTLATDFVDQLNGWACSFHWRINW